MTNQLEALIAEMKAAAEKQDKYMKGGAFSIDWDDYITPKNVLALIAALEQSEANATRLRAERDALREQELHKATNTRAAADIYFQLIEECEIPPGGSLVQHVDDLKERIAELEASKLAVKLPPKEPDSGSDSQVDIIAGFANRMREQCAEAIRAAGIAVQGDE